ncbi:uridine kinase family protein [Serinicoccus marinus]|uniref:uridine kinase family protein n=1 Tax=Serinicoccus marinus TaxID=247333 RepID=UPI000429D67B|nr:AAA family ATPase [Serinicoccus marinus]
MDPAPPPARVLVLAGPSGAGKSRLASRLHARHGWPVVQLDDFYREGTDTGLPMSPLGLPDWDHVDSWDGEAALDALEQLCREGIAQMPVYDIGRSAVSGAHEVRRDGHTVVVAEGIFAAHVVAGLRERGLLAGAWCIRNQPWKTFARRLARDLAQRRKPPLTLWRRGHVLRRAEPGIVAAQQALGAAPMTAREAMARAGGLQRPPATQPRETDRGGGG